MRMAYCEEFELRCVEDPEFPRKIVMMDESACDLDGKKLDINWPGFAQPCLAFPRLAQTDWDLWWFQGWLGIFSMLSQDNV
jgi:hypothetical protein